MKLKGPEKTIEFIDDWTEHLALLNCHNGRQLSYILRNDVKIATEALDPAFGTINSIY